MNELWEWIKQEFKNNPIQTVSAALVLLGFISSVMIKRLREFWKQVGFRLGALLKRIYLLLKQAWAKLVARAQAGTSELQEIKKKLQEIENEIEKSNMSNIEKFQKQQVSTVNYSTRMVYRFLDAAYRLDSPRMKVLEHAILELIKNWNVGGTLTIFYSNSPAQNNNPLEGEWVGYLEIASQIDETFKQIIKRVIASHSTTNLNVGGHKRTVFAAHYIEARNELVLCTDSVRLTWEKFDPYYW